MYIPFQDSTYLPVSYTELPDYALGEYTVPFVSTTAATGRDGNLYTSIANLHAREPAEVTLRFDGRRPRAATAEILTADRMDDHNSFDAAEAVVPEPFQALTIENGTITLSLPARSIVMIDIP